MYLHLGQDVVICTKDIIGIFDLDNTTVSKITREMLNSAEKKKQIVSIGTEIPKTYVICAGEHKTQTVYFSPITPGTLIRRVEKKRIGSYRE